MDGDLPNAEITPISVTVLINFLSAVNEHTVHA